MSRTASRARRPRLSIVITAGPTREFFDTVRFISNPSSGKMGFAIASAAAAAGHRVSLVTGPVAQVDPRGVRVIRVTSAREMSAATKKAFKRADAAIFTAAVCDYRPRHRDVRKVPKSRSARTLILVPNEDIAAAIGRRKGRRITIGFALEDHDGRSHAEAKLARKNCDAIVLNRPETAGADQASVEFLVRGGAWEAWPHASKRVVARRLIRWLEGVFSNSEGRIHRKKTSNKGRREKSSRDR